MRLIDRWSVRARARMACAAIGSVLLAGAAYANFTNPAGDEILELQVSAGGGAGVNPSGDVVFVVLGGYEHQFGANPAGDEITGLDGESLVVPVEISGFEID